MDWYSRCVLSWEISVTMEESFCVSALERALRCYRAPEIFNTDQGSQYTGRAFTGVLEDHGIRISMDGKGRAMDNIMVERVWRTVKYEDIYIRPTFVTHFREKYIFSNAGPRHSSTIRCSSRRFILSFSIPSAVCVYNKRTSSNIMD